MVIKPLHYVYNSFPISSGYTLRTHSIVKAQKKQGLQPAVAVSVKSLMENYFKDLNFKPENKFDNISYYSAYNELTADIFFKIMSKFLKKNDRLTGRLKRELYKNRYKKILSDYYNYILSRIESVDLMHSHTPSLVFNEASEINKFFKKKLLYEVRGFWNLSLESFEEDIIQGVQDEITACKKADKCVAICRGIADVLMKGGISSDKIEIVPNGVEPEELISPGKDINLKRDLGLNDKVIFGYITNVRWFEGIQTIAKAWPEVIKKIPDAVFLLIGDGKYMNTISEMIKEYNIERSFITTGRIEHDKISEYYSILDAFIVPRINVPVSHIVTPLKPLEAMANGKAVIVSDVNALKEMVIDGETGLYFKADDHNNLADICIRLGKDNRLRDELGRNARKWVIENRTWDKVVTGYTDIYKDLLS